MKSEIMKLENRKNMKKAARLLGTITVAIIIIAIYKLVLAKH